MILIPIQYRGKKYPEGIEPRIEEIAGHFDKTSIKVKKPYYSLHTEYSAGGRKLNSELIKKYNYICEAQKKNIPELWYCEEWALQFANFIREITKGNNPPTIVEIHPPFSDYCGFEKFIEVYKVFENRLKEYYPDVIILIENRNECKDKSRKFLVSNVEQIVKLSEIIDDEQLSLKITLDVPNY